MEESIATARHGLKRQSTPSSRPSEIKLLDVLYGEWGVLRNNSNKYFKEFAELTVSVDKALAHFATHPEMVLGLFGRYCEESGLPLKQAA